MERMTVQKQRKENSGEIVSEFLDYVLSATGNLPYVDLCFQFIGRKFACDRIYIFEISDDNTTMDNTYEWCAEGVIPQKDMLQAEPISTISPWIEIFKRKKSVLIRDLEEIRDDYPLVYAGLKPQNITSLICEAFWDGDRIVGFIGLDNPLQEQVEEILDFLGSIRDYILHFIRRNNYIKTLNHVCYHDLLTGAFSRQSLDRFVEETSDITSLGIIHFDLTSIQNRVEYLSPEAIDRVILKIHKLLREIFPFDNIYRIWGVKFVVACPDISQEEFKTRCSLIKTLLKRHEHKITIGSCWSDTTPINISDMLLKAERNMFHARIISNKTLGEIEWIDNATGNNEFLHFIKNNYFNTEVMLNSISSLGTNYLYFGDLQTNVFYISDNMRDNFGFKTNLVPNLPAIWEKYISNKEDLQLYKNDVQDLMNQRKDIHDLRYRVRDADDNIIWIHCKGYIHWNEERTTPLFFSGSFISQEHDFVIDSITNFPRETAAATKLQELHDLEKSVTIVGFGLNNFSEINELKGRAHGDRILSDIALNLMNSFDERVQFYRLDGMRFAGILSPAHTNDVENIVEEIRNIITAQYRAHMIAVKRPCSIAVISANPKESIPFEILSNVISMISIAKNSPETDFIMHSAESLERQHRHAEIVLKLNDDVENDLSNFRIVIQPTVHAKTRKISGGEVLLRWKFKGNDISPEIFIDILEKNRLIHSVGRWVFEQTVRAANRIISLNPHLYLSFNVSYLQILDPSFVSFMEHILKTYKLDPSKLVLELTETHFDDSPQKLQDFFLKCRNMNINIALDDFGKGYSSLGLLLKYPTQVVKLDRSILNEMSNSEDNQKFIASVVYACHAFGKKVCAEGVETAEETQIMQNAECDLLQGYHFSKPLEIDDFFALIAKKSEL